jgi:Ser/Thr protein kinase RdoA (MazF antagonist)
MNIDTSFLEQCLSRYFDKPTIAGYSVMAEGKENTSVRVTLKNDTAYLLRIWGKTHSYMGVRTQSDIEDELAFMIHCREHGVPIPEIYISRDGKTYEQTLAGDYYVVMEYITGNMPSDFTPAMIRQIAQAMAHMHKLAETFRFPFPRSWPGSVIEVAQTRLKELAGVPAAAHHQEFITPIQVTFKDALKRADLRELPRGPIHGDIFWENIKFEGEALSGIFDFDDCRESYFLEDISKSLTIDLDDLQHGLFGAQGENVQIFLEAYNAVRPLTDHEKLLLPLFLTASYLSRLARYLSKTEGGTLVYLDRVAAYRERYVQNQSFFLPS